EESLAAGLALAARDRAQRVETARDRAEKAFFRLHVGRNRPEERRLRLVGAVGTTKALDGGIRLPAGFEEIVDAQPAIPRRQFGVIATAGAACVAENKDKLRVVHEGGSLGEVGRGGAVLDEQPVALADDTARTAGDLGDHIGAKALDDLVERARDGWQ